MDRIRRRRGTSGRDDSFKIPGALEGSVARRSVKRRPLWADGTIVSKDGEYGPFRININGRANDIYPVYQTGDDNTIEKGDRVRVVFTYRNQNCPQILTPLRESHEGGPFGGRGFFEDDDAVDQVDILCPGWFFHRAGDAFYIGTERECISGTLDGAYSCEGSEPFLKASGEGYEIGEPIPRKCSSFDFDLADIVETTAVQIGMLRSYSQYLLYVSGSNLVRKNLLTDDSDTLSVGGEITAVVYNPYSRTIETLSDGGADSSCNLDLSTCSDQTAEGYEAGQTAGESDGIVDGLAAEGDELATYPGPSYDDSTSGEDCYVTGYADGYSQAYESAFYDVIDGWNQASEDATSNGEADGEADCTNMDPYQTSYDDTAMGQCFGPPWTSPPYGAFQIGYCYRYQDAGDGAYAEAYDTGWENGGCTVP